MLIVLSPAKSLDFETPIKTSKFTRPDFLAQSQTLIDTLRDYTPEDLSELMNISSKLGELNVERFSNWHTPFDSNNARQTIFAFTGDVYTGLDVGSMKAADLDFAQQHLRILSGLYGLLRPLDLMQAYRLEMGTSLPVGQHKNLYEFWGGQITDTLNSELKEQKQAVLINLASNEYYKAIKEKALAADVISPVFRDYKNGQYKIISFYAKKARGMMAAWIIKNRIRDRKDLQAFDSAGYQYSAADSTDSKPVFLRKQA